MTNPPTPQVTAGVTAGASSASSEPVPQPPFLFAGFLSRLIGFIVDVLLLLTVSGVVRLTGRAVWDFFGNILPFLDVVESRLAVGALGFLFTFLLQLVYFLFFWTVVGQTPGMSLMGLAVVRRDGARPTAIAAFVRYLGYWVSAVSLGLGFLWVLVDRRRQCWHDKMAGTFVVYAAAARQYHEQLRAAKLRSRGPQQTVAETTKR